MVVFDATFLMLFLDARVKSGVGDARVDYLVQQLSEARQRIVVPTPALSELLVGAGEAGPKYLEILNRSRHFRVEPFATKAAVEAAAALRTAKSNGNKRGSADKEAPWAKVKYDRQIVAIAKATGATIIYTNDVDVVALGRDSGIEVITLNQLPDPPVTPQIEMDLAPPETSATDFQDE
jgi:predicted nucleic acid-binding protein